MLRQFLIQFFSAYHYKTDYDAKIMQIEDISIIFHIIERLNSMIVLLFINFNINEFLSS